VKTNIRAGLLLIPISLVTAMIAVLFLFPSVLSGRAMASNAGPPASPCIDPHMKATSCAGLVEMQVKDVIPIEEAHTNAVVLVTREGTVLPIFVDRPAAVAVAFRLAHRSAPHPLAQDLLDDLIANMGGKVTEVRINEIHDDTNLSRVLIKQGDHWISVTCRPSDAVSMALSQGAKIYADQKLVKKDGITQKEIDDMRQQMGVGGSGSGGESGISAPPQNPGLQSQPSQIKL
jgi:bifunctional DNase/RNase